MTNLGILLRESRESRQLSKKELSELLNVDRSTVHRYENGEISPSVSVLVRLLERLSVPKGLWWIYLSAAGADEAGEGCELSGLDDSSGSGASGSAVTAVAAVR